MYIFLLLSTKHAYNPSIVRTTLSISWTQLAIQYLIQTFTAEEKLQRMETAEIIVKQYAQVVPELKRGSSAMIR